VTAPKSVRSSLPVVSRVISDSIVINADPTTIYRRAPGAATYRRLGFVDRAREGIPASLQRLKTLVEGRAVLAPSA